MASNDFNQLVREALDGSHSKAARFGTTLFLFQGVLYALFGSASILAYLPAENAPVYLAISPLCFAAAFVIAARTDKSMPLAVAFALAAIVAPHVMSDLSSWFAHPPVEQPGAVFITMPEGSESEAMNLQASRVSFSLATFVCLGLVGAYAGRLDFKHPFSPATFPGLAWEGIKLLTRKDGTALIRLVAGVVIILLGVGLAFVLSSTHVLNRGTGKAVVSVIVAGAALSASALSFFPDS